MSERVAIVLQARMGSRRLPGKSLATIAGRPMVARVVERLRARSGLPVVLATTTLPADDVLCDLARGLDVLVLRGSADDVLARFAFVASALGLRVILRATADNPAVDLDAPRRTLEMLEQSDADYAVDHGLPLGGAVEAISAQSLLRAAALATVPYDREHVTPFVQRDPQARTVDAVAPPGVRRADLRFTVDTPEDLDYMRCLYAQVGPGEQPPALAEFIRAADTVHARRLAVAGVGTP